MSKVSGRPWISRGRRIDPGVWADNVKRLPIRYRAAVARIVWWDWFASRTVSNRWDHLDEYMRYPIEGEIWTDDDLKKGLVKVGYPQEEANRRIRPTK